MAVALHDATPLISGNSYATSVDATFLTSMNIAQGRLCVYPVVSDSDRRTTPKASIDA